jgi:hypothetical protein
MDASIGSNAPLCTQVGASLLEFLRPLNTYWLTEESLFERILNALGSWIFALHRLDARNLLLLPRLCSLSEEPSSACTNQEVKRNKQLTVDFHCPITARSCSEWTSKFLGPSWGTCFRWRICGHSDQLQKQNKASKSKLPSVLYMLRCQTWTRITCFMS